MKYCHDICHEIFPLTAYRQILELEIPLNMVILFIFTASEANNKNKKVLVYRNKNYCLNCNLRRITNLGIISKDDT